MAKRGRQSAKQQENNADDNLPMIAAPDSDAFVIGAPISDSFSEFLTTLNEEGDNSIAALRSQLEDIAKAPLVKPLEGSRKEKRRERAAKYEATKKSVKRWGAAVREIAEAEQKVFGAPADLTSSTTDIVGSFRPVGSFEAELLQAISTAGVSEQALKTAKALRPAKEIQSASVAAKRARLRQLMRYEQQRNIRVRKIKSKAYRNIARKNRLLETARLMQTLEQEDPEMAASIRAEFDEKRATMRMLKKHAARKQWGRLAARFGGKDAQKEFDRQMQQERVERDVITRIVKDGNGGRLSEGEDEEDDDEDEEDSEAAVSDFDYEGALAKLGHKPAEAASDTDSDAEKKTGIDAMPFMRAAARKRQKEDPSVASVRKDISKVERRVARLAALDDCKAVLSEASSSGEEDEEQAQVTGIKFKRVAEPADDAILAAAQKLAQSSTSEALGILAQQTLEASRLKQRRAQDKREQREALALASEDEEEEEENYETDKPLSLDLLPRSNSEPRSNPAPPVKKRRTVTAAAAAASEDERENVPVVIQQKSSKDLLFGYRPVRHRADLNASVADLIQSISETQPVLDDARRQEEVIRSAFADDGEGGCEEGALAELRKLEEEETAAIQAEKRGNEPLAGWGSWTGVGTKVKKESPGLKQPEGKQSRVFISRKLDSKVSAMVQRRQAAAAAAEKKKTPFLFADADHYEASQAQPLGPEWNTIDVHKRLIQPAVAIRPGTVITPLRYKKELNEKQLDSLLDAWGTQRKRVTKTRL